MEKNNLEKLANLFAERNNKFHVPVAQGKVTSTSPLQVQFGDSILLTSEDLVVNRLLAEGFTVSYTDVSDSGTETKTITIQDPLQVGDMVILFPDADHKVFYLMAKAGVIS